MRTAMTIVGGLLVLMGGVWFFQGIGVIPGSFMTGRPEWAVYGSVAVIVGAILLLGARRGRRSR